MNKICISLGNVCYSAQYAVKNNLRKTKNEGYNTCPFDLMVSNYKGIIDCINNDFKYFYDLNYIILENETNLIKNTKYDFCFNHESPDHANLYLHENWKEGNYHFVNNNFKNFIDRYKKRIESL